MKVPNTQKEALIRLDQVRTEAKDAEGRIKSLQRRIERVADLRRAPCTAFAPSWEFRGRVCDTDRDEIFNGLYQVEDTLFRIHELHLEAQKKKLQMDLHKYKAEINAILGITE